LQQRRTGVNFKTLVFEIVIVRALLRGENLLAVTSRSNC